MWRLASFFSPGSPVLGSLSPTQTSEPARRLLDTCFVFPIISNDFRRSLHFLGMVSAVCNLFMLISIARYAQSSLNIRSRGAKFEIFRKHSAYLHYKLCTVASTRISHLSLPGS